MNIQCLVLGDLSNDGHGRREQVLFESNYTYKEIWDGYLKASEATGIKLHENGYFCNLDDYEVDEELEQKLKDYGYPYRLEYVNCTELFELFMWLANYELGDLKYKVIVPTEVNETNIGFGLFEW